MRTAETTFTQGFRRFMYVSGSILSLQAAAESLYQLSEGKVLNAAQWAIVGTTEVIVSRAFFKVNQENPFSTIQESPQEFAQEVELQGGEAVDILASDFPQPEQA